MLLASNSGVENKIYCNTASQTPHGVVAGTEIVTSVGNYCNGTHVDLKIHNRMLVLSVKSLWWWERYALVIECLFIVPNTVGLSLELKFG